MKDNSKQAFPLPRPIDETVPHIGMTLLEYYVAHAPGKPQDWFHPVMPTERPSFTSEREGTDAHDEKGNEIYDWDNERDKQKCIQWPLAWAEEQIRQLELLNTIQEVPFEEDETPSPTVVFDETSSGFTTTTAPNSHLDIVVSLVRKHLHDAGDNGYFDREAFMKEYNELTPHTDINTFSELVEKILGEGIIIRVEVVDGEPRLYSNLEGKYFDVGGYVKEFPEVKKLYRID